MTNQITETGLAELLAAAKGDYVAVLNQVKEEAKAQDLAKAQRSTVAYRQQVWANAIAKLDRGLLARINKTMQTYLRVVKKNAPVTSAEGPRLLEAEEANGLMTEFLAMRDIEEFVKVRREDIRRAVFGHLTESFAGQGEDFPEHISGSLEVPEHNLRFSREGAGRQDPDLNEDALKERLGEELFNKITTTTVIPAQEITKVSVEKLMELASEDPSVMEAVRESLVLGDWKNPKLYVRKI